MLGLQLDGVRKAFGAAEVIRGVDLSVQPGEFCVFVGPSGCGKSTLLRMIAGLEEVTGGTVSIGGRPMNDVEPSKRGVAMVFQSYALYPHLSVRENMGFGLRFDGTSRKEIACRVEDAARVLELSHLLDRKPKALSGGQRQRVAIGRAIVRKPEIFLFDEPLSNLDAELRVHMRVEIARLHQELGSTVVYVTHDQTEAMTLADKIVVLRAGVVEQVGAPLDLYDDPDNAFIAGFIGSPKMNLRKAKVDSVEGDTVQLRMQDLDGDPVSMRLRGRRPSEGEDVTIGIRPEHLSTDGSARMRLTTDIVEHLGGESYVYARATAGEPIIMKLSDARSIRAGTPIVVAFEPERAFLFDQAGRRLR